MQYWIIFILSLTSLNIQASSLTASMPLLGVAAILSQELPNNLKQVCRNIENEAKKQFGEKSMEYCDQQIPKYLKNRNQLIESCYVMLSENNNVYNSCAQEFKIHGNLSENDTSRTEKGLIGNRENSILAKEEIRGVYSARMHLCQPVDIGRCTDATAQLVLPFSDLFDEFAPVQEDAIYTIAQPSYDETSCRCLEDKMKEKYTSAGRSEKDLKSEIDKQKNMINRVIERSLARKFANDFSVGLEDVNYYLTNNFRALDQEYIKANQLQCNDSKKFQNAMQESCERNDVDSKTRDENINALLGSQDNGNSHLSFEEKLKALSDEIMNKKASGKESRAAYDIARLGIVNKSPQLHFMNHLLTNFIQDPELVKEFNKIKRPEDTPGEVLNELLRTMDDNLLRKSMDSILKKSRAGMLTQDQKEFYNNVELISKSINTHELKKLIAKSADFSIMQYPGYRALLKDFDLFNKVRDKSVADSIINTLESNPDMLASHYSDNCNKMVTQLAEMACSPKSDYVSKVSPEELNKLLNKTQLDVDPELKDSLLCQGSKTKDTPKLTGLVFENQRILLSDYSQKKHNPTDPNKTGYENYLTSLKSDGQTKGYFSQASSVGEEIRSVSGIEKLLVQQKVLQEKNKDSFLAAATAPVQKLVQSAKSEVFDTNFPSQQAAVSNYSMPLPKVAKPLFNDTSSETKSDSKSLLREFLADENNKEEVDKHLANTSNEDLQRLMELKDSIAKDQVRLNELLRQTDQVKLQNMESNLKKMEQDMKVSSRKEHSSERMNDSSYNQKFLQGSASQQNYTNDYFRENARIADSSSAGSARTSSSRSSSGALAGGSRSPASIPEVARAMNRESTEGAIVIESSIVRTPGKTFAREELSKEVISYVNASQLNIADLIKTEKKRGL